MLKVTKMKQENTYSLFLKKYILPLPLLRFGGRESWRFFNMHKKWASNEIEERGMVQMAK